MYTLLCHIFTFHQLPLFSLFFLIFHVIHDWKMGERDTDAILEGTRQVKISLEGAVRHCSLLGIGFAATLDEEDIYCNWTIVKHKY